MEFGMPNTELRETDTPFLAPIEDPKDPAMRQAYALQEARFGKVPTLSKVFLARLPVAFAQFLASGPMLDGQLALPAETALLIRERVAQVCVCPFCMDTVRATTIRASMDQAKFDALEEYGASPLFSAAERAALDYATQFTQEKRVNPSTFDRMAKHFSEREICEIVYLVASEHLYDMLSQGLNIRSDRICDIARKAKTREPGSSARSTPGSG